ncbi:MAG: acyltransferase, partial [Colwellia sp.]
YNKISWFYYLPFSRKTQYFGMVFFKIKGLLFYRYLFKQFGKGSILRPSLFISYESLEVGENVLIGDHARIETVERYADSGFSPTIILEDGVKIEQRCHITAADKLVIGEDTSILFDVMITDIDHEYQSLDLPVGKQPLAVAKTTIGANCFIGSGAKINAGTTLGKHCVVGANAVVRGDFPDYCVIVGIPAKIVKRYNPQLNLWQKTDAQGVFI